MERTRPRGSSSMRGMQRQVDVFNRRHPVGTTIVVWPGVVGVGPGAVVQVVAPGARILGGHTAVVQVTGGHGCIALTHVKRLKTDGNGGGGVRSPHAGAAPSAGQGGGARQRGDRRRLLRWAGADAH